MGLFDEQSKRQKADEHQKNFDKFMRSSRIGPPLVQAYNQARNTSLTVQNVQFTLFRAGGLSVAERFYVLLEDRHGKTGTWQIELDKLAQYMPGGVIGQEELRTLKWFAENMPS